MNIESTNKPTFRELSWLWLKIGLLSFGGPAAQISLMHRLIVEEKKWLSEQDYLNALGFCMLLPGPEAMQLATYSGWRSYGIRGGLVAGLLFVLPGALVILGLAILYTQFGELKIVEVLFLGIKSAVLVIVIQALIRVAKKSLPNLMDKIIALLAFIGIFFLNLPFPIIIIVAAITGFVSKRQNQVSDKIISTPNPGFGHLFTIVPVLLIIWWLPVVLIHGYSDIKILSDIGIFFSKLAVVTFGGAYAVLAYLGQDVVNHWGWLKPTEMMDGLGLAETTPGPLILVTEFVGFIASYREGGTALGIAGAIVTLWVTFVPCFLWIFAGAPYLNWISAQPRLKSALSSISAAVVGVIFNLSIWFGLHVIFDDIITDHYGILSLWIPDLSSINLKVCLLILFCGFLCFKLQWSVQKVLLAAALASWMISVLG